MKHLKLYEDFDPFSHIDINDKIAQSNSNKPFTILAHGGQKKGSDLTKDIIKNRELIKNIKKGLY